MCVGFCVLPAYQYTTCVPASQKPEEGIRSLVLELEFYKLPCEFWEWSSGKAASALNH